LSYGISHLDVLESEAIHVFRKVAARFERSVLLFSWGKDSIVLVRLAEKAFRPGRFPFPLMHVDTGHNFPEVIAFRDGLIERLGEWSAVSSGGRLLEQTNAERAAASRP
jgi:sulfate adenylyltransferase subunit 2